MMFSFDGERLAMISDVSDHRLSPAKAGIDSQICHRRVNFFWSAPRPVASMAPGDRPAVRDTHTIGRSTDLELSQPRPVPFIIGAARF